MLSRSQGISPIEEFTVEASNNGGSDHVYFMRKPLPLIDGSHGANFFATVNAKLHRKDYLKPKVKSCLKNYTMFLLGVQMVGSARQERVDLVSWVTVSVKVYMANVLNSNIKFRTSRSMRRKLAK